MTTDREETESDPIEPTDVERVRVLARLISARIAELHTARQAERFTPALARELFVLERLQADWLQEGAH